MIGRTISHYTIHEKLGEGGMGIVYKARDLKLERIVALKFLPPSLAASKGELTRFEQEARAISALNHPGIATIFDVDEAEGQKYLVLEYLPGGTLKHQLKELRAEDRKFSLGNVTAWGIQIAEALDHAHRHGIIHRDVKTDNIMLTEEGKVKLTDFGLAKLRGNVQITRTASTVGTAAYMSPEQLRAEDIDRRTDIFSLGVVLYELVTSHLPFRGEFEAALSYSILNDQPEPLTSLRKDVPPALAKVITRCLEKEKEQRYQSAADVAADLKNVARDLESPGPRPSGTPRSWTMISRASLWRAGAVGALLLAVLLYFFLSRSPSPLPAAKSIAVLPFQNLSDNKEDEYFSEGITDDIIAQLSKINDLKVISRTSVMQYKELKKNVRDIGKELGVATVLEGSVRRSGNKVRVVAQLIDATNEGHLWADTYDKEMTQVFAIQSDVAQRIAAALQAKLSLAEKGRIDKKQTEDTEAYQLYLKGRFYWNKRRVEDLKKAIEYFSQATEKDPGYALAYAGLASAFVLLPQHGLPLPDEWYAKARNAATKALEIDSSLAEAHAVLGLIANDHEFDWAGAESHYRRAIELDPGYPTAHQWYAATLQYVGRFDQALSEARRAHELDPLSLIINYGLADALYMMRHYDEATRQYESTLALDPTFPWAHLGLASLYQVQGRYDQAIAECESMEHVAGNSPLSLVYLARAYAMAGRRTDAQRILNELLPLAQRGSALTCGIGEVYYSLGNKDKAFEWFEKAYQARDNELLSLATEPLWDGLRSDPRYASLAKKIGLRQ
jgi:eukaryotic-like serine/threonine-protein kinase